MLQKPSVEARQQLTVLSRQVANAVSEIVHAAEAIKGLYPDHPLFYNHIVESISCIGLLSLQLP